MTELTFQSRVIDQHKITIPKATRDLLNIGVGDIVVISIKKIDIPKVKSGK